LRLQDKFSGSAAASAALVGQGVAPGGMPLLKQHLCDGRLVALFGKSLATPRGYCLIESAGAKLPMT
jgi:hypothetical protein